jgi:N-acetylneuraminic acid mutarotase
MKKTATIFFVLCLITIARSQWAETAPFPGGATDGCYSFTLNNQVYVGGGLVSHHLYEYKMDGSWNDLGLAAAGGERGWAFSFTIGDKAYVCGGANGGAQNLTSDLWEFDGTTKAWTKRADMPAARDGGFAFSVGGKGYVGCGFEGVYVVSDFYGYDPKTDTWETLAPYPEALLFPSAFVVNDKAYVVGGGGQSETTSLYRYEPDEDTWTKLADFPGEPRQAGTTFAMANAGYYCGGMQGYMKNLKDIWRYDVYADTWTNTGAELPTDYTAWMTSTVGPITDMPEWVVFVAGANLEGTALEVSAKSYRFTPQTASVTPLSTQHDAPTLHPNPQNAGGSVLYTGQLPAQYSITDIMGREVQRGTLENARLDCSVLAPGAYSISFVTHGSTRTSRLLIQ